MLLFTNNKAFRISSSEPSNIVFDHVIDLNEKSIHYEFLEGKVLIKSVDFVNIFKLIVYLQNHDIPLLEELTFIVKEKEKFKEALKTSFIYLKAAGGVVKNKDGNILMMKRLGKWDLPKGKAEKNETSELTALREVEEECGVKIKIIDKLCTTWHTYPTKKGLILKRTRWFKMDLISDKNMKPQIEEDIEELKWMNENEINLALQNSYKTISNVLESYRKH
jgi:8-oxo-(d)GTP phosphatase